MSCSRKTLNREVRNHFRAKMTDRIKSLAAQASFDLNFGPAHNESEDPIGMPWPGFEKATTELAEWCSETVCDVWVDSEDDYVSEREPQSESCWECDTDGARPDCFACNGTGIIEPYTERVYHYSRRDVVRAVFGELAEYL